MFYKKYAYKITKKNEREGVIITYIQIFLNIFKFILTLKDR